ncbi:MAG: glycosyltransferase [Actinomycetaceae bacterium]|nr:glycosyltransferase [Actinomycetaceae bacterium]
MRIALVSDCYLPRLGGIETQVAGLAHALSQAGHEVCVFTTTAGIDKTTGVGSYDPQPEAVDGGSQTNAVNGATQTDAVNGDPQPGSRPRPQTDAVDDGAQTDAVNGGPLPGSRPRPQIRRLSLPLPAAMPFNPLAAKQLAAELPTFDVAHIHCSTVSPLARAAANTCVRLELPAVVTWHSVVSDAATVFRHFYPLKKWARAGLILTAVSGPAAAAIEDIANLPIEVLPNSIDSQPWLRVRSQSIASEDSRKSCADSPDSFDDSHRPYVPHPDELRPLRVVTACRLVRRKRVLALVKVVDAARERGAHIDLRIFGDGVLLPYLQHLRKRGFKVDLPGRVSAEQLAHAYQQSDLFISTVTKEAFGIAAMEAHACGLPVLYRKGSGICDSISDGEDGVAARSDEHLVSLLVELDRDRQRLRQLRAGALASQPLTWEHAVGVVTGFYWRAQDRV